MKNLTTAIFTLFLANISFAQQHAGHMMEAKKTEVKASDKAQTQCPMMGGAIDKNVYTDYQEKRIYFAGDMCRGMFLLDPQKYMDKMTKEGFNLENSPKSEAK